MASTTKAPARTRPLRPSVPQESGWGIPPERGDDPRQRTGRPSRWLITWLTGPAMILATVCGWTFVRRGLDRTFAWALAAVLGTAIVWMLVSVLWPARPDRTCTSCGTANLRRSDPLSTRGVTCSACGYEDASRSSFLLAEDEVGPIESIVVEERNRGGGRAR